MTANGAAGPIPGVILAGGRAKPEVQAITGQSNRALVVVNGKTLLRHVADALRAAAPLTGPLTVIGDVPDSPDYARLPDTGSYVGNVFAGIGANADAASILVTTCDLPFLTGESVAAFAREAAALMEQDARTGWVYPIVPVEACTARFPGIKRTSLKLREGVFTGGNMILARPQAALSQRDKIGAAYAARKSVLRLASMIGYGTLLRVLLSQTLAPGLLSVSYLEASVSRLLGCPVRALVSPYPEIATDVDRPSDFEALIASQQLSTP